MAKTSKPTSPVTVPRTQARASAPPSKKRAAKAATASQTSSAPLKTKSDKVTSKLAQAAKDKSAPLSTSKKLSESPKPSSGMRSPAVSAPPSAKAAAVKTPAAVKAPVVAKVPVVAKAPAVAKVSRHIEPFAGVKSAGHDKPASAHAVTATSATAKSKASPPPLPAAPPKGNIAGKTATSPSAGQKPATAAVLDPSDPFAGLDELTEKQFLAGQRRVLAQERATYVNQARMLRAEADQLAEDMEPGDVQFDDESGEGTGVSVERERDLAMSAQATLYVEDIDRAMTRVDNKTYGICEGCHLPISRARLRAMPFATQCVSCKNGGLSRR